MCAKYYENPTMFSKVTAKNVGDVFLRHTVLCCQLVSNTCGAWLDERSIVDLHDCA